MRASRSSLFPVRLECGHDKLVTSAAYFGGYTFCAPCTFSGTATHPKAAYIVRALVLRNVHCVRTRYAAGR